MISKKAMADFYVDVMDEIDYESMCLILDAEENGYFKGVKAGLDVAKEIFRRNFRKPRN